MKNYINVNIWIPNLILKFWLLLMFCTLVPIVRTLIFIFHRERYKRQKDTFTSLLKRDWKRISEGTYL